MKGTDLIEILQDKINRMGEVEVTGSTLKDLIHCRKLTKKGLVIECIYLGGTKNEHIQSEQG